MKLLCKIHRGSNEIGGSCLEIWTDKTRILVDFGLPLVDEKGNDFKFDDYKNLSLSELQIKGILPIITGGFDNSDKLLDGLIVSHAHLDHYGLLNYLHKDIPVYIGQATNDLIKINNTFTPNVINLSNTHFFSNAKSFKIGDICITPYLVDHSAFDSYAFLIEVNDKKLFYSGDFRSHGRKATLFSNFLKNCPKDIDYLFLEGTTIGRNNHTPKTEYEIENEMTLLFQMKDKINLVLCSGQNIDRLVSIFKACLKTKKLLVVDVYIASVLSELSKYAKIPFPSDDYRNIKVFFPYYTCKRLTEAGDVNILYKFKKHKITKKQISEQLSDIVMCIRPSMKKDIENTTNLANGNLIYSMWEGYLEKINNKKFIEYLKKKQFSVYNVHTSGHADIDTLKDLIKALNPKTVIPIHTFNADNYSNVFNTSIQRLRDGQVFEICK